MVLERLPANDPRTIARDIPGLFDALFPQLAPGVVLHFNRKSYRVAGCEPLSEELLAGSALQRAMLFEIAVAAGEQLLTGSTGSVDWDVCLKVAVERQKRHFDARLPDALSQADKEVAQRVADNLVAMLQQIRAEAGDEVLLCSPIIPGYQWIASGVGDFAVGTRLIEVKCTHKHFSASDYRQIVMYWLLGYAAAVENGPPEWSRGILLNPRLNHIVNLPFEEITSVTAAGRSKVELLEQFSALVGDRNWNMSASVAPGRN